MDHQIFATTPHAADQRAGDLARRLAAIDWFPPTAPRFGRNARVAAAVQALRRFLGWQENGPVQVLDADAGRGQLIASTPRTGALDQHLEAHFEATTRPLAASHPGPLPAFLEREGAALILRPPAIPVAQDALWQRLNGTNPDRALPDAQLRRLTDRVLWQCGAALACAYCAPPAPDCPFDPLFRLYEEGLFPLRFEEEGVTLWAVRSTTDSGAPSAAPQT